VVPDERGPGGLRLREHGQRERMAVEDTADGHVERGHAAHAGRLAGQAVGVEPTHRFDPVGRGGRTHTGEPLDLIVGDGDDQLARLPMG